MIDPYVYIKLTGKELFLLIAAVESRMKYFRDQVAAMGKEHEGEEIDGWDVNEVAVLQMTLDTLKGIEEARQQEGRRIAEEYRRSHEKQSE